MFTGIIEELGTVEALEPRFGGARLRIRCRTVLEDMQEGASIAVNGVCLTAVDPRPETFSADVSAESLRRSNLGDLRTGSLVNLERPLAAGGRLGGHIVQGHIDATGEFLSLEPLAEENWWLKVRVPPEVQPYVVFKGSIAIDGISLTVAAVEGEVIAATIIPHTWRTTALRGRRPGDRVNLEADILAKYVERLLGREPPAPAEKLTVEKMRELGF